MNWARVEELRQEVGEEDFAEIVELFLTEADAAIGRLHEASSIDKLEPTLHFLKGCLLNLGFDSVAQICATAELQARADASMKIDLNSISEAYQACRAEFVNGCPVGQLES